MLRSKKLAIVLACALAFFSKVPTYALDKLVFILNNGQQITFALADRPSFTFEGDKLIATDNTGKKQEIALTDVKDYSVKNITNDIKQVATTTNQPTLVDGHVYYEGLKVATLVRIIAVNGQEIARYNAPQNGKLDINLASLAKGIYIIQAGKNTIKITR
ncbi:T9SS type A sorting domain-containing protein [Prevotella melaninogenica]|uniref:Secretion protein n=1 Tax=Prevotella melaninogenica DNF00666 TaxID=1401073 RepID=A0A096CRU5_9BACT|nr:T9SS type A sorting domain-containing protein [Prevotella melaninogenica]KGF48064.1 hypothetical protein HMPREF0661_07015 [Prevotella melaninogenica DNF00666]